MNNYTLKGLLANKNNYQLRWVEFPIHLEDFKTICDEIGLDYYNDTFTFVEWLQIDKWYNYTKVIDLNVNNEIEDIELLNEFIKEVNNMTEHQFKKLLAINEVEGTKDIRELDMWGIDLMDYELKENDVADAENEFATSYGVLVCNNL